MQTTCIHCGDEFSITADQLGTRGKCPHCKGTVIIPKAETVVESKELVRPNPWFEMSLSSVGAIVIHLLIFFVLLLIPWGGFQDGDEGEGQVVQLGVLNKFQLTMTEQKMLDYENIATNQNQQSNNQRLSDIEIPNSFDPLSENRIEISSDFASGGFDETADLSASMPRSITAAGSEDFGQLVNRLKRDGLDIVITFDSTGSMDGEIQQVKSKIERIGKVLFQMVPKTRISICTYRDSDDKYLVKGLPLTSNLTEVIEYLEEIEAGGGNDIPEGVDAGLAWAIRQNSFRRTARKVILLFGDAPPHSQNFNRCLRLAAEFNENVGGVVSTVTCHSDRRLQAFIEISEMGGGEAFLTRNDREIMSQLIVLVFGSKHRDKVLEAFDLLGR